VTTQQHQAKLGCTHTVSWHGDYWSVPKQNSSVSANFYLLLQQNTSLFCKNSMGI